MSDLRIDGIRTLHVGPLSLCVAAGECVCLYGASGAGKTLLLRAVADLDPNEGRAAAGDLVRDEVPAPSWRRAVVFLAAESAWWARTVGDHLLPAAHTFLARLGFASDVLGWDVARLSTGERQRLALARVLGVGPQALLLDEPTAALDSLNVERVEGIIDAAREAGAAVLWVSHDAQQRARVCQRRYELVGGRLEDRA